MPKAQKQPKMVNLALQGGGSHGAFTWGVLDKLMEARGIKLEGISGTSAGAMNAAVLANGYMNGGPELAREKMEEFWRKVSDFGRASPIQHTWFDQMLTGWNMDYNLTYNVADMMSRMVSPYFFNPTNYDPLRTILEETINFSELNVCSVMKLFISATNVRSGKSKVFECPDINADVLLASACIPFLHQAVEIDDEYYWDGGYTGNPVVYPLIYHCHTQDIILIQINPIEREEIPFTSREIINRLNEITFNASLIREMRAIEFVTRLLEEHKLESDHYKRMNIHVIACDEEILKLGASSKVNADWGFLRHLRDVGREAADQWLKANYRHIGKQSSVDLREMFL